MDTNHSRVQHHCLRAQDPIYKNCLVGGILGENVKVTKDFFFLLPGDQISLKSLNLF